MHLSYSSQEKFTRNFVVHVTKVLFDKSSSEGKIKNIFIFKQ